jgi:hypothetical protein
VTDEMPTRGVSSNFLDLGLCFLNAVLAKICNTDVEGLSQHFSRMRLANGHKRDFICLATAARGACANPSTHMVQAFSQTRRSWQYLNH